MRYFGVDLDGFWGDFFTERVLVETLTNLLGTVGFYLVAAVLGWLIYGLVTRWMERKSSGQTSAKDEPR